MSDGAGVSTLGERWWYNLGIDLGVQAYSGGIGGVDWETASAAQLSDFQRRDWIQLWFGGHHGTDIPADLAALEAMRTHQTGERRLLVIQPVMASAFDSNIVDKRNAYLAAYPGMCFDTAGWMALNGDGSPEDNADIAAGLTPRSNKSDTIHFNLNGQNWLKLGIKNEIRRRSWT